MPRRLGPSVIIAAGFAAAMSGVAGAQTIALPEIVNIAASPQQTEPPAAASELVVPGSYVNDIPVARPGEVLEVTPGLIVTQHSGEGKANQYFLRGFNLDHGTDLAIYVDGMPVNMRTHGHGQGYADVNFLIPELVQSVRIRKGPYFADEGDFSSVGVVRISYLDLFDPGLIQGTAGSFDYRRVMFARSKPLAEGNFIAAAEAVTNDGPWVIPDRVKKFNGVVRYSQGTADNGFAITGMAYDNAWTSTDQVAERAVTSGLIDRLGSLDPSDGGAASRFSLSGRFSRSEDGQTTRLETYLIRSSLTLFNDFTYFLDDPVNGDQFSQFDRRTLGGFDASHAIKWKLGAFDSETQVGMQGRYDNIDVGLLKTFRRLTLSTVSDDHVQESSVGVYAQNTTKWTDWARTVVGVRGDWFDGQVVSDTPQNSGRESDFIASPKFSLILSPLTKTEFYFNAGTGFHSNDLRGTTITVDPIDKVTLQDKVPLLVRSKGAEVGARTKVIDGLDSSLALFVLDFDSELLFVGDAGTTEASRPSRRVGVEWTNHYQVKPWLALDLDLAYTHARFTDFDPAGDFIPGAPKFIASAAVVFGEKTGWFGTLKLRHLGPRPLTEDGNVRSTAVTVLNGRLGYTFENGFRVQLDGFNLTDTKANQIEYFYVSRLPGEPLDGVADRHGHPVEPLAVRLTLAGKF